jgi:hypothetical protein
VTTQEGYRYLAVHRFIHALILEVQADFEGRCIHLCTSRVYMGEKYSKSCLSRYKELLLIQGTL